MSARSKRLLLAGALALAGVVVKVFCFGYSFTAVLLWALSGLILVIDALLCLRKTHRKAANICFAVLLTLLGLGLVAAGVTLGYVICGAKTDADPQSDYVVVLGAGVNGTVPSRSLRERLEATTAYLTAYPDAVCIVSGGQGANEQITEAQCMQTYLVEHGIDPARIVLEDRATSTEENLAYSFALIEERTGEYPQQVTIISSEYHLFRAAAYARQMGVEAKVYAAKTANPLYLVNSCLREIPAVWKLLLK